MYINKNILISINYYFYFRKIKDNRKYIMMNLPKSINSWCKSKLKDEEIIKYSFAWTIENFSQRTETNGHGITSNKFSINTENNFESEWKLQVYPNGISSKKFLSVYLNYESSFVVKAKYTISILSASNTLEHKITSVKTYFTTNISFGHSDYIPLSLLRNQRTQLLPNDNLTLHCELTILEWRKSKVSENKVEKASVQLLQDDLQKALLDDNLR